MPHHTKRIAALLFLAITLSPLPASAFNQNYIISDQDLEDYASMTAEDVQQFFVDNKSYLYYYADFYPEGGQYMSAADIVWNASQQFKINPKFILTLLEKEQGLISLAKPKQKRLDWAMGYAVCDKCRLSHPKIIQFKGFAKQVYGAAEKIRNDYITDLEKYGRIKNGFGVGIAKKIDKKYKVAPVNRATAILYTYTPHIAGNKSFYKLWTKWFSNIKYPDGSLLQNQTDGGIFLIQNGAKRPFLSKAAFISRHNNTDKVIQVRQNVLDKYPVGQPIKFTDYSLLRDENGALFMTVGDEIRAFESEETFRAIGFSPFEVEDVTAEDLTAYIQGKPITKVSAYPTGALLQNKNSGSVYWVYDGVKYPIPHSSVLASRFKGKSIIRASEEELAAFETGEAVKFRNGELIRGQNSPTVYFVADEILRPIPSEEVFLAYGWEWKKVLPTDDNVIDSYELGPPITLETRETNAEQVVQL